MFDCKQVLHVCTVTGFDGLDVLILMSVMDDYSIYARNIGLADPDGGKTMFVTFVFTFKHSTT